MNYIAKLPIAATLMLAAAPVAAADWWLVSGTPGDEALFADVQSLVRQGGQAQLSVLRIDRAGRSTNQAMLLDCADGSAVARFACASEDDRAGMGVIVTGMEPAEVARILFQTRPAGAGRRG